MYAAEKDHKAIVEPLGKIVASHTGTNQGET